MKRSLHTLLKGSVDYAGLFPPATLSMNDAVTLYAQYKASEHSWMLGRFIVPAIRLPELETCVGNLDATTRSTFPWHISMLSGGNMPDDVASGKEFNARNMNATKPMDISSVEIKAADAEGIEAGKKAVPSTWETFVEIPVRGSVDQLVNVIARVGALAKVRTGGVTNDLFPSSEDLIRFIAACVKAGVGFKATAGLHHPFRSTYNLTYATDSPRGWMFGFLNVFIAAAFLRSGMDEKAAEAVLLEESELAFGFHETHVEWRGQILSLDVIAGTRARCAHSFGSCSFVEPIEDLKRSELL